ncbi:MAG: tetratricopeptide repeat protein [Candidatus Poribacteria bacterium]|nr:tetratricopeptide repeat protein [Candidatus Poribacteria bacterium]
MTREKENSRQQHAEKIPQKIRGTLAILEVEVFGKYIGSNKYEVNVSTCSGFFIERNQIATSFHVLEGAMSVTAKHVDKEAAYTIEGITAFDEKNDLAILKVSEEETPFRLGNSETVKKKARICAIGYDGDKENNAAATVRCIEKKDKWLRLHIAAGPGWSGCPVLNNKGEVIAVLSRGSVKPSRRRGHAVPSNVLETLLTSAESTEVQPLAEWQNRPRIRAYLEYKRGVAYQAGEDFEDALAAYNEAINLNPDIPDAYKARGETQFKLIMLNANGNYKQIDSLDFIAHLMDRVKAYGLMSTNYFAPDLRFFRSQILARLSLIPLRWSDPPKAIYARANAKMRRAKSKVEHGDITEARKHYHAAIADFTRFIESEPKHALAYNARGWTKYLLGQIVTGAEHSGDAEWYYQSAVVDSDVAIELAAADEDSSAAYHTRGAAKAALGDHDNAMADFDAAIRLNPETAINYLDRGLAKEALGEKDAAKADFEKATQINGDLAKDYYKDGRGKNSGGAYEAAMVSFDKAIRLNPKYAPVYSNRAISQNDLGRRELRRENPETAKYHLRGAIADCTEAIRLSPKYTAAYNNRGLAKYRLGQSESDCGDSQEAEKHYQAAIADLDKAIQLNPKHVKAHRNRGYVKERLGQQEAAEADFEKAKALDSAAQTA